MNPSSVATTVVPPATVRLDADRFPAWKASWSGDVNQTTDASETSRSNSEKATRGREIPEPGARLSFGGVAAAEADRSTKVRVWSFAPVFRTFIHPLSSWNESWDPPAP